MRLKSFSARGTALAILAGSLISFACGPDFPNNLLDRGDEAVFVAPVASFQRELERMNLVESRFLAVPLETGETRSAYANQSQDAELRDLAAALQKLKLPADEAERICAAHHAEREKIRNHLAAVEQWQRSGPWRVDEQGTYRNHPVGSRPKFPVVSVAEGLPAEFGDYFEGAIVWQNPAILDKSMARVPWERLLERPTAERRYKSTWAAFMLGKSWEAENSEKAITYYRQVRELARRGFADSVGLAAASLGLEARIYFQQEEFERAIDLYLEQLATGDASAPHSLRIVAVAALKQSPERLGALAKHSRSQRVITAFLISQRGLQWNIGEIETLRPGGSASAWLDAVELADVADLESAEKLALAAYQANEMDTAQRWIKRARQSPVAQWIQAKLLLRDGKVEAAAALLAKLTGHFPLDRDAENATAKLEDTLRVKTGGANENIAAGRQLLGELGLLRLARREYAQALDAMLRAGFWMDAAYVAERVLTVDELKDYVERHWPALPPAEEANVSQRYFPVTSPAAQALQIRYLLARRLTRDHRGSEARAYFPVEWQPHFDELARALGDGWNERLPADQRATALFEAAKIARFKGMELMGTETAPDWRIYGGAFEFGVVASNRTDETARVTRASADELRRATQHSADPEARFHYRYQAAFLAWEAARLMPDNSEETARVLCVAGSWLKYRDPETADLFYKALVRRNRQTVIGAEADRIRWFPKLDGSGQLMH